MDIKAALRPRCPKHPEMPLEGGCLICTMETPQERDARMAEFHKEFPALARPQRVTYRTEAEAYGEGIEDDD